MIHRAACGDYATLLAKISQQERLSFTAAYKRTADASLESPNREGWGSFTLAYTSGQPTRPRNPPTGKVGDLSLWPTQANSRRVPGIPQPERLGIFHSGLHKRAADASLESPNRKGWGSFTLVAHTSGQPTRPWNPPTGRLGSLLWPTQANSRRVPGIPQPEGWGSFTLAYTSG
jgi:hypothetical protein